MDRNSDDPAAPTLKTETLADGSLSQKPGAKAKGRGEQILLKAGLQQGCSLQEEKIGLHQEPSPNS